MKSDLRAKQKCEALKHVKILTHTFHLTKHLESACRNEQLELCFDCGDLIIREPIEEHEKSAELVRKFEEQFDAYAYYAIDGVCPLIVLHISHNENAWESLRPVLGNQKVYAAAIDTESGNVEFGFVKLSARQGTLLWVDPYF